MLIFINKKIIEASELEQKNLNSTFAKISIAYQVLHDEKITVDMLIQAFNDNPYNDIVVICYSTKDYVPDHLTTNE